MKRDFQKEKYQKNTGQRPFGREASGQVMLEFTFCVIVILLMLFSLIMVTRWAGVDLGERRKAHDQILVRGSPADGVTNYMVPERQLDPYFYDAIKMNAVWDGR